MLIFVNIKILKQKTNSQSHFEDEENSA